MRVTWTYRNENTRTSRVVWMTADEVAAITLEDGETITRVDIVPRFF